MGSFAEISLLFGVSGVMGTTILFPLLGGALYWWRKRKLAKEQDLRELSVNRLDSKIKSFAVLVPCAGETELLKLTLESINKSIQRANKNYPKVRIKTIVAIDGPHNESLSIAEKLADSVFQFSEQSGKWNALKRLIFRSSSAEWVGLADCGITWNEDLLIKVIEEANKKDVIGVCPSYRSLNSGGITKLIWKFESYVKEIENLSGGPVSVHGASVFYRREPLLQAILKTEDKNYLNDDVVIPLMMRALNIESRFVYLKDTKNKSDIKNEIRRRKRILEGNLQWIVGRFPEAAKLNPVVGLVAFRRVFRLFWAYWGILIFLSAFAVSLQFFSFELVSFISLVFISIALIKSMSLLAPFLVSLAAPVYLILREYQGEVSWK
jgi:cellulose synthase/poly-beta-1,6-N-acetylglucosamine synthase-like glycosyltransferase